MRFPPDGDNIIYIFFFQIIPPIRDSLLIGFKWLRLLRRISIYLFTAVTAVGIMLDALNVFTAGLVPSFGTGECTPYAIRQGRFSSFNKKRIIVLQATSSLALKEMKNRV